MSLDNLKEGVFKPDLYEPALNPVYAATLVYYEVVADPARGETPIAKDGRARHRPHPGHRAQGPALESIEEQNAFPEHWK